MALRRIEVEELEAARRGTYVRGARFAVARTSGGMWATMAWGALSADDGVELVAAWRRTFSGAVGPSLIDIRALTSVDPDVFARVRDMLEPRRAERARTVSRQAILANDELGGGVVLGYLALFPPPYDVRAFSDRTTALSWLGCAACAVELDELAGMRDELVDRLRAWLQAAPTRPQLDDAVAALGVTRRTLQRRLAAACTRFSVEVARVQIARAQQLMLDPDTKLSSIALQVGCATPSAFSELFVRATGETPLAWRRRHNK